MNPATIATANGGTVAERAIAILIAAGMTSNRAIAEALGITPRAVQKARKKTAERTTVREPQFAEANHSSQNEPQFANQSSPAVPLPPKRKVSPCTPSKENYPPSPDLLASLEDSPDEVSGMCLPEARPQEVFREEFEVWYQAYPRHVGRGQALKAYCSARRKKKVPAAALLEGAKKAAERYGNTEQRYTPHPATWLNGERWLDEPEKAKPAEETKMPDWWRELIAPALEQDISQVPLFGRST